MEGIEVRWDSQQVEGYALSQENWAIFEKTLQKYLQAGLCRIDHNRIQLSRAGKLQADAIAADLFI
jgi:coproporphyrinogen III oxidase-like Fe-S oxidoreductase